MGEEDIVQVYNCNFQQFSKSTYRFTAKKFRLASRLGEENAREDDRAAHELSPGQRFAEQCVGNECARNGLEHRGHARPGRREVAKRRKEQEERHDRADEDDAD
jgi:hypothetical protein